MSGKDAMLDVAVLSASHRTLKRSPCYFTIPVVPGSKWYQAQDPRLVVAQSFLDIQTQQL